KLYLAVGAYLAAHAVGIGEAVDVVLLPIMIARFGSDAYKIVGKMGVVFDSVLNAKNDIDLEFAANAVIDISLLLADIAATTIALRQQFRSFKSLREDIAASLAKPPAGGSPTAGTSPAIPATGASGPLPPNSAIPSGNLPGLGPVAGSEPGLAAF